MSTLNRKWSLVAFEYVMQWLLWTVILPNKHPIPVCAKAESGCSRAEKGRCAHLCSLAVKGKEAGGEQLWNKTCSRPPSSLHQIYLGCKLYSVHLVSVLLCYFWNWTDILVKVLLYLSMMLSPLFIPTYVATNCVIAAMCSWAILAKTAMVTIFIYSMQLRRS